jgi:hypothetical protein
MRKTRKRKNLKRVGYAAVINMQKTLTAHQAGKLPRQVTIEKLIELGIASGDALRVKNTLIDLTFIDRDGYQTHLFERLATVSEEEYREILADVLHHVYTEVFDQINPATATQAQLKSAFSVYAFPKLHRKMVALFRELAQQAGLVTRDTEVSEMPDTSALETQPPPLQEPLVFDLSQSAEEGIAAMAEHPSLSQASEPVPTSDDARAEELGEFLTRLFQLPKSLGWTEENRVWWRQAISFNAEQIVQALTGQEAAKR